MTGVPDSRSACSRNLGQTTFPIAGTGIRRIIVSPHSHTRLYFAANKLFRSDDRGDTWKTISPDLTRQIDRDTLPVMGRIWGPDAVAKNASTSFYGNIVALAESPMKDGLIYVGTDDGLIQVTNDAGGELDSLRQVSWRSQSDLREPPAGLPAQCEYRLRRL